MNSEIANIAFHSFIKGISKGLGGLLVVATGYSLFTYFTANQSTPHSQFRDVKVLNVATETQTNQPEFKSLFNN
jgi:hypothetical protein